MEALKNKVYRKSELVKHYELLCISCGEEQPDNTILLVADSTKYHGNIQFAVNNIRQWQEDIQIELKRNWSGCEIMLSKDGFILIKTDGIEIGEQVKVH